MKTIVIKFGGTSVGSIDRIKKVVQIILNYKDYLVIDQNLVRPAEVDTLLADFSRAKKILNWEPKISFDDLVKNMVEHDLEYVKKNK